MDIDIASYACRNGRSSKKCTRLKSPINDVESRHRTLCSRERSGQKFRTSLIVHKLNAPSLWNMLLIILACALFTNAKRYSWRPSESHDLRDVDEEYVDNSASVRGSDGDLIRRNMHMFAVVGHHFNRSLAEEIEAFDSGVISDGDVVKVHFPRYSSSGSEWLVYHGDSRLLQGVPLLSHEGPLNFYVTIVHINAPSESVLTLPCTVEVLTEHDAVVMQRELPGDAKLAIDVPLMCSHHDPVTIATISLGADTKDFSHQGRLNCVRNLGNFFGIPAKDVTFHPSSDSMRRDGPILSGPGNSPKIRSVTDRDATNPVALSWPLGCSTDVIGDVPHLDLLETSALDGSLAQAIGYDISEWQIVNRVYHSKRAKRDVNMASPKASKLTNSHNSNVKSLNVPQTEETVAATRNGRTRVALNAIRATPVPIVPVQATKMYLSPMDRSGHDALLSTPAVRPPMSATFPDYASDLNQPPMLLMGMDHVDALYGTYMEFRIPNDVFYDTEDDMTWNLKLEVIDSVTNEEIPDGKSWVMFDADAQLLYGVPDDTAVKERELVLLARDSGGKSASMTFLVRVDMSEAPKPATHNFTFFFSEWPDFDSDNVLYTVFGRKLTAGLAQAESVPGRIVPLGTGLVRSSGQRFVSWFDRSINREDWCESKSLEKEAGLMIGEDARKGWNQPASEFANKFKSEFKLKKIWIDLLGPCFKHTTTSTATSPATTTTSSILLDSTPARDPTPPYSPTVPKQTTKSVPSPPKVRQLTVQEGKVVRYPLPLELFVDFSGAGSDLKVLVADPSPRWIALDSETRTLFLMPTREDRESLDAHNSTYKRWKGGVVTENANGAVSKLLTLEVLVQIERNGAEEKANHKFGVVITNYELTNFTALDKARLIDSIANVFGDEDGGKLYFYPAKKGSVIFSWHNSSLAYVDPCPYRDIAKLASIAFKGNDFRPEAKEKFQAANFTIKRMELIKLTSCAEERQVVEPNPTKGPDDDVAIAGRQGKSTTIIIIAVVVVCLVVLIVILVVKCRMGQASKDRKEEKTEKLVREEAAAAAGDGTDTLRIKKGVPIILQGEMEPNGSSHASPATPLVTYRENGSSVGPSVADHDENLREETLFTGPSSRHAVTPPTPIMAGRPPPPYVKSR